MARVYDVDTAGIHLAQARGVLDVVVAACERDKVDIEGGSTGSLVQALYAAMSEIDRAREAILGRQQS